MTISVEGLGSMEFRLRSGRRPGFVVGAALMVVLCAFVLAIGSGTARADGPCTDVEVIGLRGSSEAYLPSQHGMGSLLGPVADTIATDLSSAVTFSAFGLPYPASEASISTVLNRDYFDSKNAGSAMLHQYLQERTVQCPATRFVVMGYSQGAHAAGDQLARESKSITDRIAALVMFGDPRFNPEASYALGTFDSRDHGLAGPRSTSDFASWHSRVYSFCHQNDMICQGIGIGHGTAAHSQAKYVSDYAELVAGLVRHRLGLAQLPRLPLDLAFVIDSTGSMSSSIDGVREAASSIADKLEEKGGDYRVALVDYKDTDQGDPYAARVDTGLAADTSAFRDALEALEVEGGGDYPEAVFSGVMKAYSGLGWRTSARKAVILMGDAPGKDPEPVTGYTRASVLSAGRALGAASPTIQPRAASLADSTEYGGAAVYSLAVGPGPLETFEPLAEESGGRLFVASSPSDVSEEVVNAVDSASGPAELTLAGVSPTRPGIPVPFNAGATYTGGEVIEYAWDFDGDGVVEETTAVGQVEHAYPEPFEGFAKVTAVADDGHEMSASTPVVIDEFAPVAADAPRQLELDSPGPGSLRARWLPPSDLGEGSLLGYQVTLEDSEGGLVAATALDPWSESLWVQDLPDGAYSAVVAAVTEAGPGAVAKGTGSVAQAPVQTPPPAPAAISPAAPSPAVHSPARRCKRGFRRARVHGKARCVKRKHRHRRGHFPR